MCELMSFSVVYEKKGHIGMVSKTVTATLLL